MVRLRPGCGHDRLPRPHRADRRQFLDRVADQGQRLLQGVQVGAARRTLMTQPLVLGAEPLHFAGSVDL
jgi:hypothetical protein